MRIKGLIDECFNDYKKPAMYIAFPDCSFKCDVLNGCQICQNSHLAQDPDIEIKKENLIERYLTNPITEAIICSGLEPFDSILDLISFISCVRDKYHCMDDIIIYTGYTEDELREGHYGTNFNKETNETYQAFYRDICQYPNIIIKFGRFIMNDQSHFDSVLGINLNSLNQYARKVSINDNKNEPKS